jgi:translation elongation factor EF-1beta
LGQAVIPLEPKPLLIGVPIELGALSVNVEGKETVTVGNVLKKVFGYDNYKTLQTKIESGEVGVIFKFDNGYDAFCRDSEFNVRVSVGAKSITAVKVYPVIKEINIEKVNEAIINEIKDDVDRYKIAEEQMKSGKISEEEAKGKMSDTLGDIGEGIAEVELKARKEEISKYLGVPPERLFIKKLAGPGQVDFEIHQDSDKGTLLAIVEIKTSTKDTIEQLLSSAEDQLRERFSNNYKNLEHGFAVAILIGDVEKLIQTGAEYKFKMNYFRNPYKK